MNKIMKRILAMVMALSLCLALVACGNKDTGSTGGDTTGGTTTGGTTTGGDTELTSYAIAYNTWGAGTATFDFMATVIDQALAAAGAEGTRASDDNQADKELQNIQNFVNGGYDGIIMQTAADTVLPQAAAACLDAQVPFVMTVFTGTDEDRAEISANNEYYLGAINADMYAEGYLMGKAAAEDGMKTVVMVGGNVGDPHMEMRIAGFSKAFVEEGGGEILNEARCANPGEGQEKSNAMLSATPDADCLFAMVGDYVPGAVSAMETLDNFMPIYVTNANTDAIPYIRNGQIAAATTGNDLVSAASTALLINYLDGHQILDENGKAPELKSVGFVLDENNVDDYERIFLTNGEPFPAEVLQSLLWRYNPDVTYADIKNFVETQLNLDAILQMW